MAAAPQPLLQVQGVTLQYKTREHLVTATYRVSFRGRELKVGPTEFKLLHYLMKHAERVHTRGTLLDKVWGDHVFIEERTVDVHVKRLREALGEGGALVETVRGAGYRITDQPA